MNIAEPSVANKNHNAPANLKLLDTRSQITSEPIHANEEAVTIFDQNFKRKFFHCELPLFSVQLCAVFSDYWSETKLVHAVNETRNE